MAQSKSAQSSTETDEKFAGLSEFERNAVKERAQELKAEARRGKNRAKGENEVLAKIADMPQPDRGLAERIHALVTATAPDLSPKTWYGMPAYAKDGKVVCFFQSGQKYETRYCSFGFQDKATLDDGTMWPISFALTADLTADDEATIAALVKRAVS